MITSASGPPQETILLKNIDSKMIQKKNSNQLRNQFPQVCLQLAGKIFICV
jgi:hypothetical protein